MFKRFTFEGKSKLEFLELFKYVFDFYTCPFIKPLILYNDAVACLFVYSTNGTVINMSKVVKKQTQVLQNGDVIYFVYRKSEPEQSELLILLDCF